MKVTTAVIMAAGYGTRMLPVTASIPKVLLPILNRPVVDYVVDDCIAAGITNIIFVMNAGSRSLQDFYSENPSLDAHLIHFNKTAPLNLMHRIRDKATFTFVEQSMDTYGTAIPVQLALPHIRPDEAFMVSEGDGFSWHEDGTSEAKKLVDLFEKSGADGAVTGVEKPLDEIHKYGVFDIEKRDNFEFLKQLVEKPDPGTEPSNVANISRYVLTPAVAEYVRDLKPNPKSGEYYLTDAVSSAAEKHKLVVHRATGNWMDAGSTAGWLKANLAMAGTRPDLAKIAGQ